MTLVEMYQAYNNSQFFRQRIQSCRPILPIIVISPPMPESRDLEMATKKTGDFVRFLKLGIFTPGIKVLRFRVIPHVKYGKIKFWQSLALLWSLDRTSMPRNLTSIQFNIREVYDVDVFRVYRQILHLIFQANNPIEHMMIPGLMPFLPTNTHLRHLEIYMPVVMVHQINRNFVNNYLHTSVYASYKRLEKL